MRRIKQRVRLNREDGATAVIVAILAVVIFGLAALAIDVGALYWERSQLQSGADAGSLAVAQDVAAEVLDGELPYDGTPDPEPNALGGPYQQVADYYTDQNAADGEAEAEGLYHQRLGPQGGEVSLVARVIDGNESELQHWFAPLLGIDSSVVRATAVAEYAPLVGAEGAFPVVICEQVFDEAEDSGDFVDLLLKGTGNYPLETDCNAEGDFPGGNVPGNFSWLEDTDDGECATTLDLTEQGSYEGPGDEGASIPSQDCRDAIDDMVDAIQSADSQNDLPDVPIAIFSTVEGQGSHAVYTVERIAVFRFSAVDVPSASATYFHDLDEDEWNTEACAHGGTDCAQGQLVEDFGPADFDWITDPQADVDAEEILVNLIE